MGPFSLIIDKFLNWDYDSILLPFWQPLPGPPTFSGQRQNASVCFLLINLYQYFYLNNYGARGNEYFKMEIKKEINYKEHEKISHLGAVGCGGSASGEKGPLFAQHPRGGIALFSCLRCAVRLPRDSGARSRSLRRLVQLLHAGDTVIVSPAPTVRFLLP